MVNLRAIANRLTSTINPNLTVQYRRYAGYTTAPGGKTTPRYDPAASLVAQVQALTRKEVEHLDAMNISNCDRSAYVNGQIQAYDRFKQTGGDVLFFEGQWWKAMAILEGWTTAGWCKVALVAQQTGPT